MGILAVVMIGLLLCLAVYGFGGMVEVKGPGGRCKTTPEHAAELCKRKGFTLLGPVEDLPPPAPADAGEGEGDGGENAGDSDPPVAAKINRMSNAKLAEFVEAEGLEINLDEFSNLAERRAAVIGILANTADAG